MDSYSTTIIDNYGLELTATTVSLGGAGYG